MRHIHSSILAILGLLVVSAPLAAQAAPTRIGYIDTRRVFQEAPGAQTARETLEREMAGWQQQMQAMEDSLQTIMADYQQRSLVMSAEARQRQEQQIMERRQGFAQRAEQLQEQAGRRQQELMEPIMQRVEEVISQVRQAEGFAIVFDVAADAIVSADPSLDLTERVIERLRASGPAASR
ncbi:MAG TPA: OmpH family outer membrane protein [Longimicrobiales bacterium]|nr:OmpH family outer membrane protein [Longimicrobiales bacterium]